MILLFLALGRAEDALNFCDLTCVDNVYKHYCGDAKCTTGASDYTQIYSLCTDKCAAAVAGEAMFQCLTTTVPERDDWDSVQESVLEEIFVFCNGYEIFIDPQVDPLKLEDTDQNLLDTLFDDPEAESKKDQKKKSKKKSRKDKKVEEESEEDEVEVEEKAKSEKKSKKEKVEEGKDGGDAEEVEVKEKTKTKSKKKENEEKPSEEEEGKSKKKAGKRSKSTSNEVISTEKATSDEAKEIEDDFYDTIEHISQSPESSTSLEIEAFGSIESLEYDLEENFEAEMDLE